MIQGGLNFSEEAKTFGMRNFYFGQEHTMFQLCLISLIGFPGRTSNEPIFFLQ
jgi:hypothetical protein